ncbi:hypothetical protein ACT8ZS_09130 [Paenibacillus sp. M.A.Huq-84]
MTLLLTPHLRRRRGRFINTSFRSHKGASLHSGDWERTSGLRPHAVYARSKLALGILLRKYGRRHPDIGFADFHPGIISSDFGRYMGFYANILRSFSPPSSRIPFKEPRRWFIWWRRMKN